MKTISLLVICCLVSVNLFSQAYTPLISQNKTWKVTLYGWGMQYLTYTYGNPVTVNQQTYFPVMSESESDPGNLYDVAYIREDAAAKKVYILNGSSEFLLYDFDVIPGQVISIYAFGYMRDITITSVGTVPVNGEFRGDIQFTDMGVEGRWVGGMGSIYGPHDATLGGIADYSPIVTCYYEDGSLAWDYTGDETTCDATLGLAENILSPYFCISPNPARESIQLQVAPRFAGQQLELSLVALDGKKIQSQQISANDRMNIRLPSLPSGVYLLRLLKDNEIIFRSRLEIE